MARSGNVTIQILDRSSDNGSTEPLEKRPRVCEMASDLDLPNTASQWMAHPAFDTPTGSWATFDISVKARHVSLFKLLLQEASAYCGLEYTASRSRGTKTACVHNQMCENIEKIVEKFPELPRRKLDVDNASKILEYICGTIFDSQGLTESEGKAWGTLQSHMEWVLASVREGEETGHRSRSSPNSVPSTSRSTAGGNDRETSRESCEQMYQSMLSNLLSHAIPKKRQKYQGRYGMKLLSYHDMYRPHYVTAEPGVDISSSVYDSANKFKGLYSLLVGQMKKEQFPANPSQPVVLHSCAGTIHEHLAELLVCMRNSVFAQDWRSASAGHPSIGPLADRNYIFGMISHKSLVQLTCLCLSSAHLSRITQTEIVVGQCIIRSLTHVHSNRQPGSIQMDQDFEGCLYVSPPIDVANIFSSSRAHFEEFMGFLTELSQYAVIRCPEKPQRPVV